MAELATAPAPTAPSTAPSTPPAAAPSTPTVTPSIAQPVTPSAPAKKGSARERMREDLAKIAKPANGAVDPATAKPVESHVIEDTKPLAAVTDNKGEPVVADKPDKKSPWKVVDDYKARLTKVEAELATAKSSILPENDRKAYEERTTKAEARIKELEEHMRFVDYSKTEDFTKKYKEPYEKAWSNAVSELKEITITDSAGNERPVSPQDIVDLVNLPLGKAREIADATFGKFADDVMAHRKQIKGLWDAQQQALEEAKKSGGETLKQQQEAAQKNFNQLRDTIKKEWDGENAALLADKQFGPLFSQREGDDNWNQRLANGFELVDKAFSQNPSDPKLTPEERKSIIRLHTAVRNRAAAWGAVNAENQSLKTQLEEVKKELGQYKASEPGSGGGRPNGNGNGAGGRPMTAREKMHEDLRKMSKAR